jgi:hypothetical protein
VFIGRLAIEIPLRENSDSSLTALRVVQAGQSIHRWAQLRSTKDCLGRRRRKEQVCATSDPGRPIGSSHGAPGAGEDAFLDLDQAALKANPQRRTCDSQGGRGPIESTAQRLLITPGLIGDTALDVDRLDANVLTVNATEDSARGSDLDRVPGSNDSLHDV